MPNGACPRGVEAVINFLSPLDRFVIAVMVFVDDDDNDDYQ